MEGSLVAYKVFTNGSVLQASEINENLMRQSVAVFSNAAARTAAIASPVEGQMTWLEDLNRYESWNGSLWTGISGLNLIRSSSFSGALSHSFGSDADPIFTSRYESYKILLTGLIAASSSPSLNFRVRANITDLSSAQYSRAQILVDGSSVTAARVSSATSMTIAELSSTAPQIGSAVIEIQNPALLTRTNVSTNNLYYAAGGTSIYQAFGAVNTTDAYNGFTIFTTGPNISGTMSVFGYNK
jgi:hypothetical protein